MVILKYTCISEISTTYRYLILIFNEEIWYVWNLLKRKTSFIHVYKENVRIFAFAVIVLLMLILRYVLLNHIRKVSIIRAGNMSFMNETL